MRATSQLNGMRGIRIDDPFGIGMNTNVVAHQNCIKGNSIAGMEVEPGGYPITPQLDAKNNWWGHASGPMEIPRNPSGAGDRIIDLEQNVDFIPWLLVPPPAPCPAAPPPPNTPGKVTGGGADRGRSAVLAARRPDLAAGSHPESERLEFKFHLRVRGHVLRSDRGGR